MAEVYIENQVVTSTNDHGLIFDIDNQEVGKITKPNEVLLHGQERIFIDESGQVFSPNNHFCGRFLNGSLLDSSNAVIATATGKSAREAAAAYLGLIALAKIKGNSNGLPPVTDPQSQPVSIKPPDAVSGFSPVKTFAGFGILIAFLGLVVWKYRANSSHSESVNTVSPSVSTPDSTTSNKSNTISTSSTSPSTESSSSTSVNFERKSFDKFNCSLDVPTGWAISQSQDGHSHIVRIEGPHTKLVRLVIEDDAAGTPKPWKVAQEQEALWQKDSKVQYHRVSMIDDQKVAEQTSVQWVFTIAYLNGGVWGPTHQRNWTTFFGGHYCYTIDCQSAKDQYDGSRGTFDHVIQSFRFISNPGQTPSATGLSNQSSAPKPSHPEPTPSTTTDFPKEHFPQTRTHEMTDSEVDQMSYAQVRYAINEIYARHGANFQTPSIRHQFETMSWYKPRPGKSADNLDSELTATERNNMLKMSKRRDHLVSIGQNK